MGIYVMVWRVSVGAATSAALLAGASVGGWQPVAVTLLCWLAGGILLACGRFHTTAASARTMLRLPVRLGVCGMLLVGLPTMLGMWSIPVMVSLGVASPSIMGRVVGAMRPPRPADLTSRLHRASRRDLERRWMRTSDLVAGRRLPAERLCRIADERAALLDELEHRDPEAFAGWLALWAHTCPPPARPAHHIRVRPRRLQR